MAFWVKKGGGRVVPPAIRAGGTILAPRGDVETYMFGMK